MEHCRETRWSQKWGGQSKAWVGIRKLFMHKNVLSFWIAFFWGLQIYNLPTSLYSACLTCHIWTHLDSKSYDIWVLSLGVFDIMLYVNASHLLSVLSPLFIHLSRLWTLLRFCEDLLKSFTSSRCFCRSMEIKSILLSLLIFSGERKDDKQRCY